MAQLWVRIDSTIASNDKILNLIHDASVPAARRWQSFASYICAIGWSAQQATDGLIPRNALPFVHGSKAIADLLVAHRLWEPVLNGWVIHNYAQRQELSVTSEARRALASETARRAACARWHGVDCWGPKGCSRDQGDGD
jgi:hypothetical protein